MHLPPDSSLRDKLRRVRHLALDLDGTLYLGGKLFEFTLPFLQTLVELGIGRTFITNNSSRSTRDYVEHLCGLNIEATSDDILSSTTATLEYLREQQPDVRKLFVLGTPGLRGSIVTACRSSSPSFPTCSTTI